MSRTYGFLQAHLAHLLTTKIHIFFKSTMFIQHIKRGKGSR